MRTEVATRNTKAITYEMLRHGLELLQKTGRFDSKGFRIKFDDEYVAAPCRFSMTGGVLVEIGVATLSTGKGEEGCWYSKRL